MKCLNEKCTIFKQKKKEYFEIDGSKKVGTEATKAGKVIGTNKKELKEHFQLITL